VTGAPDAHEATLTFTYDDQRRAGLVADAVGVEVGEIADGRSRAAVDRDGRRVVVTVRAADLVALRAGVNTWSRLVEVAERVTEDRPTASS
jgi:KEOPS complex subunit Pcc1